MIQTSHVDHVFIHSRPGSDLELIDSMHSGKNIHPQIQRDQEVSKASDFTISALTSIKEHSVVDHH